MNTVYASIYLCLLSFLSLMFSSFLSTSLTRSTSTKWFEFSWFCWGLFCILPCGLSLKTFHVHLKRMYILSSGQDGGIGRNPSLPRTTKRRITTNLISINNQKRQKIKLHGIPTTKELKRKTTRTRRPVSRMAWADSETPWWGGLGVGLAAELGGLCREWLTYRKNWDSELNVGYSWGCRDGNFSQSDRTVCRKVC